MKDLPLILIDQSMADAPCDSLAARSRQRARSTFPAIHRSDKTLPGSLTATAIRAIFLKRGEQAKTPDFSPHDLRRSFASNMLDASTDITTVQQLMGHSSLAITAYSERRRNTIIRLRMPRRKQQ